MKWCRWTFSFSAFLQLFTKIGKLISLLYMLMSRITCNNQNHSRFLTLFITLESESVFCWVGLIGRCDCQGVDLLLIVFIFFIIPKTTCRFLQIYCLLLRTVPDYSRPAWRIDLCGPAWIRIFTWDVYWGTFQSTDSGLHVIYSRAGSVTTTWQMKIKTVSLFNNMKTFYKFMISL